MSKLLEYLRLCRLCLVKDNVNVPIFADSSDVRQIFLKISACLPVKVSQDDNLPKHICDNCLYKVDLLYQFWNTTVHAEKQLIEWFTELGIDVNTKNKDSSVHMIAQSHAHPHSIPETIILKEEHQDIENQQSVYPGFEITPELAYQPQVNLTVGAPTDFTQSSDTTLEEVQTTKTDISRCKRRGRPPKQKTTVTSNTLNPVITSTDNKKRSSATKAASIVATSIANLSSDDSDIDDKNTDENSDEDFETTVTKEEADSEDEEYVDNPDSLEPTTFVDVPSSTCDMEQPGPSGLVGATTLKTTSVQPANTTKESGPLLQPMVPTSRYEIIGYVPINLLLNPYSCQICGKRFATSLKMRNHRRLHKPKDSPCKICGKLFRRKFEADAHERRVHTGLRAFNCDLCEKKFKTKTCLDVHKKRHNKEYFTKCEECGKMLYGKQAHEDHVEVIHRGVRYICFPCNKVFKSSSYLHVHRREKHNPIKQEEKACPECGKKFASTHILKKHISRHKFKKQFMCDECGKSVTTASSLKHHKNIHSGIKPFVCDICGKSFNKKDLLKVHYRIHTKEKPHKCSICQKCFTQRSTLTIHMRYHTGERPYICNICNKKFVSKNSLTVHAKMHGTSLFHMNK